MNFRRFLFEAYVLLPIALLTLLVYDLPRWVWHKVTK